MSTNASPHRFCADVDSFCDPEFTADISNKMRVPQRISVIDHDQRNTIEDLDHPMMLDNDASLYMHVPDKILITGAGHRAGMEDVLPEARLEESVLQNIEEAVHLSTPPRCLTLDAHSFPSVEEEGDPWDSSHRAVKLRHKTTLSNIPNGDLHVGPGSATPPGVLHLDDEMAATRRQLRVLSRRLMLLEQDNQQRQQREVVLYSVGVLYFLLKGLMWLQKHW